MVDNKVPFMTYDEIHLKYDINLSLVTKNICFVLPCSVKRMHILSYYIIQYQTLVTSISLMLYNFYTVSSLKFATSWPSGKKITLVMMEN